MTDTAYACRLYLVVSHAPERGVERELATALDAGDVGCVLLHAGADGRVDHELARALIQIADARDVAFLLERDAVTAATIPADGVHIPCDDAAYAEARAALGVEAIIGAECPPERHAALTLAEQGADYIAFTAAARRGIDGQAARAETVRWWAEIIEVPVVAWEVATLEEARRLAQNGADFVAIEEAVWRTSGGAAEAVRAFGRAVAKEPMPV